MKKSGQKSPQGSRCPLSPHITCVRSSKHFPQKQLMDIMFIVGGWTPTSASCAVERFDPFYNEWRTMAPMLKRYGDVAVCSLGGMIFTTGGHDDITCVSSVEKYDSSMDVWSSEVASLSSPRSGVCVVEMDGFMFALGGFDGAVCTNIVERYDPVLNTWTKMAPMHQHRSGATAAVLDGFIYVMGGTDGDTPLNSVERFNPLEGMWRPCPPMRTAREQPGCAVYLGRIYVAGGRDELRLELSTAEKFYPDNQKWTPVKPMGHKRFQVSLTVFGGMAQMGYQLLHRLRLITPTQTLGDTLDV
ncbi:kelch-like protein 20 [Sinocyclocheilus rhinocerous]|uniref:kelch-like protein 20 n=1 Tax=Sinocyclocheilus rhinocerous TaxID=307959 RepID=UPI0007BA7FB2|nr:PREDICTED: kelch-like protein 20 [Sinocyclocheilus rhinocerous]